jgi:hypothetical protein
MIFYDEYYEEWEDTEDPKFKVDMTPEGPKENYEKKFNNQEEFWDWYVEKSLKKLNALIETNFDPSDINESIELAYSCLKLMKVTQEIINFIKCNLIPNNNYIMQASCRINELGKILGLLSTNATEKEIKNFKDELS